MPLNQNHIDNDKSNENMSLNIQVVNQQFPLKTVFRISRGAKTHASTIVITLTNGTHTGWAEAVPYGRYDESIESVSKQIDELSTLTTQNIDQLIDKLPAGAARNALDCAWLDLQAKQQSTNIIDLLDIEQPLPCTTAQTLSIDTSDAMANAVKALNNPPLVKVKLDNQDIVTKMQAICKAAPNSQFIIDANEGWTMEDLINTSQQLASLNVVLIEQPLPAGQDQQLIDFDSPIPLCADESCHTRADLDYLKNRYQVINIKLDKTGGLTEALQLAKTAKSQGFDIMLGCMVASSLAMAPISLLVNQAKFVDLDGPLLISKDRQFGFEFEKESVMLPLKPILWGGTSSFIDAQNIAQQSTEQ